MAQIQSGAGSDLLTIDTVSKAARASLYDANGNPLAVVADTQPASVSGLLSLGMNDRSVLPMRLDRFGSQAQASHQPMFVESFEGGTLHPIRWTSTATTMAATQSSIAGLTINSGAITTVTTGYMLKSNRAFLKSQRQPLHTKIRARPWHFNNSVMELGFGDAATFNGAHTTGAYWQVTATGVVQPVLTYNGVDQTGADATGLDFIAAPDSSFLSLARSAALMILGRKRSLFSHILCMIIASFRATAILAFEKPIRLARRTPHAFRLFQSFE